MTPPRQIIKPVDARVAKDQIFDVNKVVDIVAGTPQNQRTFHISEDLITSRSDFFLKALQRPWLESEQRIIRLVEEDPGVFAQYVQLLYTDAVPIDEGKEVKPEDDLENIALAKLYVVAHKLQDVQSCNRIMDTFLTKIREPWPDGRKWYPGVDAINIIYEGTGGDCAARRFMADLYAQDGGNPTYFLRNEDKLPKSFLLDVCVELSMEKILGRDDDDRMEWCEAELYHEEKWDLEHYEGIYGEDLDASSEEGVGREDADTDGNDGGVTA